jgi:hypothetical protein
MVYVNGKVVVMDIKTTAVGGQCPEENLFAGEVRNFSRFFGIVHAEVDAAGNQQQATDKCG